MDLAASGAHHERPVVQELIDNPELIDLILVRLTFWRRENVVRSPSWRLTMLAQLIHNEVTRLKGPFRHDVVPSTWQCACWREGASRTFQGTMRECHQSPQRVFEIMVALGPSK
jgi:hypothetical protein